MAPTGKPQLLSAEPSARPQDLQDLLGLANAIEVEAVARYAQLAAAMEERSEPETAAAFREMCEIEKRHVAMVGHRAEALRVDLPPAADFTWQLPPEIAGSWDEARHSALLTPYRALAIAVTNEERAFALYSYLAASSDDPEVMRECETLAAEELAHAAELRVRRRRAFHREFPGREVPAAQAVRTPAEFRALDERLSRQAAATLAGVAQALAELGDSISAELVAGLAEREAGSPDTRTSPTPPRLTGPRDNVALLQEALRPLETASEIYEEVIARAARDDLLQAAQAALHRVVEGIAALGRRLREIDTRSGAGQP